jgi:hypothetical protein
MVPLPIFTLPKGINLYMSSIHLAIKMLSIYK